MKTKTFYKVFYLIAWIVLAIALLYFHNRFYYFLVITLGMYASYWVASLLIDIEKLGKYIKQQSNETEKSK